MAEVPRVFASKEFGLLGDRYGKGGGSWSRPGKLHRQVSLIAQEAIQQANSGLTDPFLPGQTRRNIVVSGIDPEGFNGLVDKTVLVGKAKLLISKLCEPCERPARLAGKPDGESFKRAFANMGGLCAQVVDDGLIEIGDSVSIF
ncbi:MAG: MOSC domain-containing protein [Candidatus Wildermuthbacteria bacterium]|nr:MOSC domain-containing protein [Candidatus Wildermuthbacteria bacterium]